MAFDPDNPGFVRRTGPGRHADWSTRAPGGRRCAGDDGLPDGASFDPTRALAWATDFDDAGLYRDASGGDGHGDGTGTPAVTAITCHRGRRCEPAPRPCRISPICRWCGRDAGCLPRRRGPGRRPPRDPRLRHPRREPGQASSIRRPWRSTAFGFGRIELTADGPVLRLTPEALERGDWLITVTVEDTGARGTAQPQSDRASSSSRPARRHRVSFAPIADCGGAGRGDPGHHRRRERHGRPPRLRAARGAAG